MHQQRAKPPEELLRQALRKVLTETSRKADVLAFRLIEDSFLVPASDVKKVVSLPEYTLIPGAKPWVLGVAKDREGLYPVFDLGIFAAGVTALRGKSTAGVLIARTPGGRVGLLVTEILGLRQLPEQLKAQPANKNGDSPLIRGSLCSCVLDDEKWHVIDLATMLAAETFQNLNLD